MSSTEKLSDILTRMQSDAAEAVARVTAWTRSRAAEDAALMGAQPAQSASGPAPAPAPPQQAAPPPAATSIPPTSSPPPAAGPVFEGECFATCFANKEDEGSETPATPTSQPTVTELGIKIQYQDGMRILGVALPWKLAPGRCLDITDLVTGRTVTLCHEVDGGPWVAWENPDPWLERGTRPYAESLKGQRVSWSKTLYRWVADAAGKDTCNGAGADLMPLVWAGLKNVPPAEAYAQSYSGMVRLREYDAPAPTQVAAPSTAPAAAHTIGSLTLDDVVARARSGIPLPVTYELAMGGGPATAPLPGTVGIDGVRRADCSGFGDYCEGISRDQTGWNTDYAYDDATGPQKHYRLIPHGEAKPGQKLVASAAADGLSYGHEAVISAVANGVPTRVIHCSSMNPSGHAIAETDPSWFTNHHAIVVEFLGLVA